MLTSAGRPASGSAPRSARPLKSFHQRVREVLVERDDPGVVGPGHHPAAALLEQPDADLAAELVVDVTADAERQVDLLGLEPGDLAGGAARTGRRRRRAACRAAPRRPRSRGRPRRGGRGRRSTPRRSRRSARPRGGGGPSGRRPRRRRRCRRCRPRPGSDRSSMTGWSASESLRMLARRYHDDRCQNRLAAASASDCVASSRSSLAAQAGTRAAVGQSACDVGAVERLGRRPQRLRAEPERLALVRRQPVRGAVARRRRSGS